MLTVGTAPAFGFAAGLLIGGANRLLVAAAFLPVAMMGLTLLDRIAQGRLNLKRRPRRLAPARRSHRLSSTC